MDEYVPDIFGRIIIGPQVEEAVIRTLKLWMPTYIQELELQLGRQRGKIPAPKMYATRNEFDSFPNDKMPMCIVVSPGLASEPTKEGDGTYSAWWSLGVGFAATARDPAASGLMSKVLGACGRAILLHNSSLIDPDGDPGFAQGIEWVDESYDDLVATDEATIRACYNIYRVNIWDVVTKGAGPATPIPDPATQPGSQWPTADIVDIAIELAE